MGQFFPRSNSGLSCATKPHLEGITGEEHRWEAFAPAAFPTPFLLWILDYTENNQTNT